MVKQLLSWEWLKEVAHQLEVSIWDLFTWNSYERWRSFWQLGLVTTGGWLAFAWGKKIIKIGKNISKEWLASAASKLGAWLIVETSEFANIMKSLPEYAKKTLNGILARIGKREGVLMAGRYIEGGELIMINKFIKAFEVNHKLLWNEQYAYMSSAATYMLMRHHNILPWDLDVAVNPKNMSSFINKITKEITVNPKMEEATFIELLWNGKTEVIPINNMDRIKKVAEDGRLNISYKIEWLEVELFPEIDGKWLTNIWYMDKAIISHKIKKWWETIVEVPSLDNKWVAQWYILNYLDEFGNSTIDWIESKISWGTKLWSIKMKDTNRINNIYILLKDAWLIKNPEQLLKFIDETVKIYNELPNKWPYVANAINEKNVLQGIEKLKKSIEKFYDELNIKIDRNTINNVKELPNFKQFSGKLKTNRITIFKYYQEYLENWNKLSINKTELMIQKTEKYLHKHLENVWKIEDFAYYYEIQNTYEFIKEIKTNLYSNKK